MNEEDQMINPLNADLLSSEEEFGYHSDHIQPLTSFFTTLNCYNDDIFLQQFASSQSTNELIAMQYFTGLQNRLTGDDIATGNEHSSLSEYSEITAELSMQSFATASHLIPELLNSIAWDHWLCNLATSLTRMQWQFYWINYLAVFGTTGLPQHLVNFFATAATLNSDFTSSSNSLSSMKTNTIWQQFQQQFYGVYF